MSPTATSQPDEHEAFAASRVTQYVFCPTKDTFFNTLDQHADTSDKDIKPPLVVVGNDGSGKSALLANWVSKRREHLHRDEFLFQHFVGCTTPSLSLAHTLQRLESKLKEFYQLREMKVPDTEEELRWSLGRFLSNAAKKHSPARVIIIIDGVGRLKCEGMPDGSLHWVPTELPPCVRFILSTVELERLPRGVNNAQEVQHRSFIELTRRNCPLLRIEPLSQQIRNNVIHAFLAMNAGAINLTDTQQFKIISAPTTSQPMYLRSLLQGVRICSNLTNSSVDQLLETFLHCSTAHELVDKNLNICCQSVFPNGNNPDMPEEKAKMEILGKIFTIVHISRTGLTEAEIWGVIRMVTSIQIEDDVRTKLMNILSEFTMVVDGMHSFSHELYREVVYDKYICSKDNLIRWHQLMARYFSQLETGPRKLVALPYHLEVAGSWSKVKNCLTDIKMFQLWWTRDFKADFIKTWAQLTRVTKKETETYGGSSTRKDHESHGGKKEPTRPTYDVVEEYVKSLDEYRSREHPSDEEVSSIILLIADFLLEFATLGHEANADVPNIIHPFLPPEDMASIGVPYIKLDDIGRSVLYYPDVYPALGGIREGDPGEAPQDQGGKAIDDIPYCTTYFFHRWMWIQYPYIALGNCNSRYVEGEENKKRAYAGQSYIQQQLAEKAAADAAKGKNGNGKEEEKSQLLDTNAFKLPEIKFNRKAAKTFRRVPLEGDAAADKFAMRMQALQDDIQNYREEYDFVMQMKAGLRKRLAELSGSLESLKRSAESVHQFDDAMQDAVHRDKVAAEKYDSVKLLNANLKKLNEMCERHPPNVPALILEIERKIAQDKFLLEEIKVRLWEQKFERLMHNSNFKIMKFLSKKGENMHNQLLECRISMKVALTQQAVEMDRAKEKRSNSDAKKRGKKDNSLSGSLITNSSGVEEESAAVRPQESWADMWAVISSRTGIAEPSVFFDRLRNGSGLTEQIGSLRKQAEARLEALKTEHVQVEEDMEFTRLSVMNGDSDDNDKSMRSQLAANEKHLKIIKEKALAQEQLETTVISGLGHLGELLGVSTREEGMPVADILRDVETLIDTLMDEREKQMQQNNNNQVGADANNQSRSMEKSSSGGAPFSPALDTSNRPSELDLALQRFEAPTLRLPPNLPSRPILDTLESASDRDHDDGDDDEGMWDRNYVLSQSLKFSKMKRMKESAGKAESKSTEAVAESKGGKEGRH